jgi:hypothetical protein
MLGAGRNPAASSGRTGYFTSPVPYGAEALEVVRGIAHPYSCQDPRHPALFLVAYCTFWVEALATGLSFSSKPHWLFAWASSNPPVSAPPRPPPKSPESAT